MHRESFKRVLLLEKERIDNLLQAIEREEKIDSILEEGEQHNRTLHRFPWFHPNFDDVVDELVNIRKRLDSQQVRCRFTEQDNSALQMLTGSGLRTPQKAERKVGLNRLREFTSGASSLLIIDPYIFDGENRNRDSLIADFKRVTQVERGQLKSMRIIYNADSVTSAIRSGIKAMLEEIGCRCMFHARKLVHDRVWIKNHTEGILVGHSFNGIGGHYAFILDLPNADVVALKEELEASGVFNDAG